MTAGLASSASVLALCLAVPQARALESNEHRELGNCALALAQHVLSMATNSTHIDPDDKAAITSMQQAIGDLRPPSRPGVHTGCRLPEDTNGPLDWLARIQSNGLIQSEGKDDLRIWPTEQGKGVAYGHISALVDSYVYPSRLVALNAYVARLKTPSAGAALAPAKDGYEPLPRTPAELFSNPSGLPLPEDIRAIDVNDSHFRGLAVISYLADHRRAKRAAAQGNYYGALVANAIADHFLLDLFAPGHVMAARQTIPGEFALGMHDYANRVGVHFMLDDQEQLRNLNAVLTVLESDWTLLFSGQPKGDPHAPAAQRQVRTQLGTRGQWLVSGQSLLLRGDNFLTSRRMGKAEDWPSPYGPAPARQYLFLLAAQTLSILDALLPDRMKSDGHAACPLPACKALPNGFDVRAPASASATEDCDSLDAAVQDAAWIPPVTCKGPPGDPVPRAGTPRVRICCGVYQAVEVTSLEDWVPRSWRQDASANFASPQALDQGRGSKYVYPTSDHIVSLGYQREYRSGGRDLAPYTLALTFTDLWHVRSGEVSEPTSADHQTTDSHWRTASASLRLGSTGGHRHYGVEGRFTQNFFHTPWRAGAYVRLGVVNDEQGQRKPDNSVGGFVEMTTTFFRFGLNLGSRGFPVSGAQRRYYGFEVHFFLPSSRVPLIGKYLL